jgi:hypothetical protein
MDTVEEEIIELEKAALTRWGKGDPAGFLEITAKDIVYFDPYIGQRIVGLAAPQEYYRAIWGKVRFEQFELLNPAVQVTGHVAVLTFNYVSYTDGQPDRWNCTEVYRQTDSAWKIIQSHWSYTDVFKYKMSK